MEKEPHATQQKQEQRDKNGKGGETEQGDRETRIANSQGGPTV